LELVRSNTKEALAIT